MMNSYRTAEARKENNVHSFFFSVNGIYSRYIEQTVYDLIDSNKIMRNRI